MQWVHAPRDILGEEELSVCYVGLSHCFSLHFDTAGISKSLQCQTLPLLTNLPLLMFSWLQQLFPLYHWCWQCLVPMPACAAGSVNQDFWTNSLFIPELSLCVLIWGLSATPRRDGELNRQLPLEVKTANQGGDGSTRAYSVGIWHDSQMSFLQFVEHLSTKYIPIAKTVAAVCSGTHILRMSVRNFSAKSSITLRRSFPGQASFLVRLLQKLWVRK